MSLRGHHDPHAGVPICDALEPDGFEGEDDADLERQEQEARARSDANMAFIAHARTALLERVKDCRALRAVCHYEHFMRAAAEGERDEMRTKLSAKQIALDEAFAVIERQRASLAEAVRALEATDENVERVMLAAATAHYGSAEHAREVLAHRSMRPVWERTIRAALSSLPPRKDTP